MARSQKSLNHFIIALIFTFITWYFLGSRYEIEGLGLSLAIGWTIFTAILGLISYSFASYRHNRAMQGKQKAGEAQNLEQSRTIEVDLPFEVAYETALAALESLDDEQLPHAPLKSHQVLHLHETQREIGRIKAGIRTKTIGITDPYDTSKIEIQIQRLDEQTSRLLIESRSAMSNEVYDMGRNLHFVNALALFIRQESELLQAESHLQETHEESIRDADKLSKKSDDRL